YEIVDRDQKAVVAALHHRNEAVLDLVKPYFAMSERFLDATADLPWVGRLPTPKETVAQWFGFFGEILKEDRELLLGVVSLLPERTVELSASKPAAKAA
ncbi:MAG TPA: hypothetical protein VLX59_00855, partial [Acidimicrobiales bacterium]|nr:hypothetical protein [Acidimicrobiales bacterium]